MGKTATKVVTKAAADPRFNEVQGQSRVIIMKCGTDPSLLFRGSCSVSVKAVGIRFGFTKGFCKKIRIKGLCRRLCQIVSELRSIGSVAVLFETRRTAARIAVPSFGFLEPGIE
jgi:hypothetical protein